MKKLLLLIITTFTISANGQTSVYHPFPMTHGIWDYRYYDDFHMPTNYYGGYQITGDTTISGVNYKIISGCGAQWVCDRGGIRESNKIIYFRPDTATSEYVLYDFNKTVGDTIIHPYGGAACSNDTVTIVMEDSVQCSDGYHRQLWLSSSAIWIEGVGSLSYLLNPCNVLCVSGNDALQCMSGDSGFSYPYGNTSCFVSVSENILLSEGIYLFPNPFHTTTTLEFNKDFKIGKLNIYNSIGKQVRRQNIISRVTLINRDGLEDGSYFYQLISDNGQISRGKFIVE